MRYKKRSNGAGQLARTGLGLAAGSVALGALGGQVGANANAGLVNASSALPVVGTLYGLGMVAGATRGLANTASSLGGSRRRKR